jgi:hypothetical protein
MILNPGKPAEDVKSYRPISLLAVLSKVFEKLFTTRIHPILQSTQLISDHQFGFRPKHTTIEQAHRITTIIHGALEHKQYWTAAFLDQSGLWQGLARRSTIQTKNISSVQYVHQPTIIFNGGHFRIKYRQSYSSLRPVLAGVPLGSVLGPLFYLIYTADLPTLVDSTTATFADDTAVLTVHKDPTEVTHRLQRHLKYNHGYINGKWRLMKQNLYRSTLLSISRHVRLSN